jgi:Na+/H+ ion antiporter subunit
VALVALNFLLSWLGAAPLPSLRRLLGRHLGRWVLVPPAVSLPIALAFVTPTSHGRGVRYTLPRFAVLGVNFSLWIDRLSVSCALVIAGIGLLITLTGLANMIALTLGTLTLDISQARRHLYVHMLNLDDPEDVKQEIRLAFEVHLRELSLGLLRFHERTIVHEGKTIEEDIGEPHRDA